MDTAETETSQAKDRLERVVEATQDAVVFIDARACIVRFNPAAERVFGYSKAEVMGENVRLLMPDPYASEHDAYIRRYEETGTPKAIGQIRTVRARRKSGEEFPIELSVAEVSGDPTIRYCAFIRDISETLRLQAENADKRRLATIGATAAALAHEVGNPLNNMRLSTQLAARRLASLKVGDEQLASYLGTVTEEIARLSELLDEFRMLSRRQTLHLSATNLSELIDRICSEHHVECTDRGIEIERQVGDVPPVRADAAKLRQVLLNLCKNAMEAMSHGGTLRVDLRVEGKSVVLEVGDTGVGIPQGIDVFEAFETTKERGTGLGLSIVRQVIRAHGGDVSFVSFPGQGTTFRLRIPVDGPPSTPSSTPPPPPPKSSVSKASE